MKIHRLLICCAAAVFALCAAALAETARVLTPGGPLNVRRTASASAKLVTTVPNRSLVEVIETAGEWSKITYENKTGYVKTSFLKLASELPGKTVYPDSGALLRAEPRADAAIIAPVGGWNALTVESLADGWARVRCGDVTGYVPAEALSYQLEEPSGDMAWIKEPGVICHKCSAQAAPDAGDVLAVLEAGTEVTVTEIAGKTCLVLSESGSGYVPVQSVRLRGTADETANLDAVTAAETALKKAFKDFAAQKLYATVAIQGDAWRVGFFNAADQYMYGALVRDGQAVFTGSYADFAAPEESLDLLPEGQVDLTLSAETLAAGDVLDIAVTAWTRHSCAYSLARDGKVVAKSADSSHFAAAYRPREAGEYLLTVTVADESGRAVSMDAAFSVTPAGTEALCDLYSQKDGWWLDRPYRSSTLDQSGCAIFTLSHALQRMGHAEDSVQPQALARQYALCLTPDGTNNERLIREAAAAYGFSTRSALITDAKQIASLLRDGAMFSFSIARGHIALIAGVSEDGTMVRVIDSAPGATFTRIVGDSLYRRMNSGTFRAAVALDDIPGARWYFETGEYGGLEYWLRISYAAKRGVRLIQP